MADVCNLHQAIICKVRQIVQAFFMPVILEYFLSTEMQQAGIGGLNAGPEARKEGIRFKPCTIKATSAEVCAWLYQTRRNASSKAVFAWLAHKITESAEV